MQVIDSIRSDPSEALWAEIQQEVEEAYRDHAAGLLRYAMSLARNPEAARDAVQEVFLRYFSQRRFGGRIEKPRAWLYEVLHNYILEKLQQAARQREIVESNSGEFAPPETDPDLALRGSQGVRQIASILTNRELACLRLRAQGLEYAEIGETLGIRVGTVGALLTRAHERLRTAAAGDRHVRSGTADALRFLADRGGAYTS
jgi:RNA polymerase sigma-70 factor (ECF subfamily)